MKKFFEDFKKFISKGNVLDLAVGVIIGGAFGKIVSSMVNDILMPLISFVFKGDITNMYWLLRGTDTAGVLSEDAVVLYWGKFLQSIIDFFIIGLTLFIIVKVAMGVQKRAEERKQALLAKLHKGEATEEEEQEVEEIIEEPSEDILLLREIRDALKPKKEEKTERS